MRIILFIVILNLSAPLIIASPEEQLLLTLKSKKKEAPAISEEEPSPFIKEYEKMQKQSSVRLANKLKEYLTLNIRNPFDKKILRLIQHKQIITTRKLIEKLSKEVNKGFKFQTGDIITVLRHMPESYLLASLIDDAFSHSGIIFIEKGQIFITDLNSRDNFKIFTLADYLLKDGFELAKLAVYRLKKQQIDKGRMKKLISSWKKYQHNIFFDRLMIYDVRIKDPEKDFQEPLFLYCGELVYESYAYLLGSYEFSSEEYGSLRNGIMNRHLKRREEKRLLNITARIIDEESDRIIAPKTFTKSAYFKKVLSFGEEEDVNKMLEKIKP